MYLYYDFTLKKKICLTFQFSPISDLNSKSI